MESTCCSLKIREKISNNLFLDNQNSFLLWQMKSHIRDKQYEQYSQKIHIRKLANMKAAIDNQTPPVYPHLQDRAKRRTEEAGIVESPKI